MKPFYTPQQSLVRWSFFSSWSKLRPRSSEVRRELFPDLEIIHLIQKPLVGWESYIDPPNSKQKPMKWRKIPGFPTNGTIAKRSGGVLLAISSCLGLSCCSLYSSYSRDCFGRCSVLLLSTKCLLSKFMFSRDLLVPKLPCPHLTPGSPHISTK